MAEDAKKIIDLDILSLYDEKIKEYIDGKPKAVMCYNAGDAWTEDEQAAARARLGINSSVGVEF